MGARNPKVLNMTVRVAESVSERLNRVADAAGANKGTLASMCLSAGLNLLEPVYLPGVARAYAEQMAADRSEVLAADVTEAAGVSNR